MTVQSLSHILFLLFLLFLLSCKPSGGDQVTQTTDTLVLNQTADTGPPSITYGYDTTKWREISQTDSGIALDLRYGTNNNFVHEKMYECGRCFLRPSIAKALLDIQESVTKKGYRLKLFDCYRPLTVQQRLWDKLPDPRYVMRPEKGSMHNRGMAVDLTLIDSNGVELDMGTPFDSFDRKSHHDAKNLPTDVMENRTFLKALMEKADFKSIRTEWWHYSYSGQLYEVDDWEWGCE